jgi:hypothetical protein
MSNRKSIVVTAYGHDKTVDKIAVSSFDGPGCHSDSPGDLNARRYCDAINSLELKDNFWVLAKIVSEYTQYGLDAFIPLQFGVILTLDDLAIQKMMREIDSQDLAKALKGAVDSIREKIFRNMSAMAAQMLKEDMEYMGPVAVNDIRRSREKILNIIHHLEQTGEIIVYYDGETIT